MKLFLKIAFYFISLSILFNSCSLRHHAGFTPAKAFEVQNSDFIANQFQRVLFNTQIQAFGKDFSGLLFIKLVDKDDYRFVFLTQLGLKIFDIEFKNNEFQVHQLVSYLDRKSFRKVLENDLKLIIQKPQEAHKKAYFKHKSDTSFLLREKDKRQFHYFQYQNNRIRQKENASCWFSKTKILYTYKGGERPSSIHIKHSGINLEWTLLPIKKKLKLETE